jgi:Sel1 repeat
LAAIDLFHKAAEQGYAASQVKLGECFQEGRGVDQHLAEAARWFRKAAGQGDPDACLHFGKMFAGGDGVVRNCDEALFWLRKCDDSSEEVAGLVASIEVQTESLKMEPHTVLTERVRAGDSVSGGGITLLHFAASHLLVEPLALLFEHPSFDALVVRIDPAGQLPRTVIGDGCEIVDRKGATERVFASVLSCRRSTRAACLMWCLEQASTLALRHALPREVGVLIARSVLCQYGVGDLPELSYDPAHLVRSVQSAWRRPSDRALALEGRLAEMQAELSRDKRGAGQLSARADDAGEPQLKRTRRSPSRR